jgi:hypothetical protein
MLHRARQAAATAACVAAALVLAACREPSGGPTAAAPATPGSTDASSTGPPPATSSASGPVARAPARPTSTPDARPTLPRGGRTLLPGWRIVAYYGAAGTGALGVLGSGTPDQVWPRLATDAARFESKGTRVLPTYELIVVIANSFPGPDGRYRTRVDDATVGRYLATVRRHHALLLLDIQPGHSDFPTEVRRLERWLRQPDVALAIDPEWRMSSGGVPGQRIGTVSAAEVNVVSGWLDALTARHRLPQKLLLVHQFTTGMITNKAAVQPRRNLAIVFNMDGFGGREAKLTKYRLLQADRRFGLGLKLFLRQDIAMFRPHEVLRLRPIPNVVEYQ